MKFPSLTVEGHFIDSKLVDKRTHGLHMLAELTLIKEIFCEQGLLFTEWLVKLL